MPEMNAPPVGDWAPRLTAALGEELRAARDRRGWSRKELVARLANDLSLQAVLTYEAGTRSLHVLRLVELCGVLGVSPMATLERCYERVFCCPEMVWVDLAAASQLDDPRLAPLRRWAAARLTRTNGILAAVRLGPAAIEPLAVLCGMNSRELVRRLPAI